MSKWTEQREADVQAICLTSNLTHPYLSPHFVSLEFRVLKRSSAIVEVF